MDLAPLFIAIAFAVAGILGTWFSRRLLRSYDALLRIQRQSGSHEVLDVGMSERSEAALAAKRYFDFEKELYERLRNSKFYDDSFDAFGRNAPDFTFEAFNKRVGIEAKLVLSPRTIRDIEDLVRKNKDLDALIVFSRDVEKSQPNLRPGVGARPHVSFVGFSPDLDLERIIGEAVSKEFEG